MEKLFVTRELKYPDPMRWARFAKCPELGPRILFFSGGSALRDLSRKLTAFTHNSIHLITPFDSGGSSAELRKHFPIFAVGDFRNRLMALADQSFHGNPKVYALFSYRFPQSGDQAKLEKVLDAMVEGSHPLVAEIPDPMRKIVRNHLSFFKNEMPRDFPLRGASVGNLILVGGYLNNGNHLDPVLFLFSKLVSVRGVVRPVVGANLHLAATLADGSEILGQHLITEKNHRLPKIMDLRLSRSLHEFQPARARIRDKIAKLIAGADLICYPMGSFFTSLIASLLPEGVGEAVAGNGCPKVYIPNSGTDSEQRGMSLWDEVQTLLRFLNRGLAEPAPVRALLNFVVLDSQNGRYRQPLDLDRLREIGIQIVDMALVSKKNGSLLDETKLTQVLLSLV